MHLILTCQFTGCLYPLDDIEGNFCPEFRTVELAFVGHGRYLFSRLFSPPFLNLLTGPIFGVHFNQIGSRGEPFAYDNELSSQAVELSGFRIAKRPVSNGDLNGAVSQHEYQWEVAARAGLIEWIGQVWEWCANPFHPYPEFRPFPDSLISQADFDGDRFSLRGASLHTQGCLRRASFRSRATPGDRQGFIGSRLVFPHK